MLIGHLPAGYLTLRLPLRAFDGTERRRLTWIALGASVAPDLDLLYFYGVDSSVHHHALFLHWPSFWLTVTVIVGGVGLVSNRRLWTAAAGIGGSAALLHLVLDSIAGSVRWLAPFSDLETTLVVIPPGPQGWIWSFVTHWTFGVEIAICVAAGIVWLRARRRASRFG